MATTMTLAAFPDDVFLQIIDGTSQYAHWRHRREMNPFWFFLIQASKTLALKMWGNAALWRDLNFGWRSNNVPSDYDFGRRLEQGYFNFALKVTDASMMTDIMLDSLLRRINAREVTQSLKLRISGFKLDGSGLAPLKDSRVLSTIDLRGHPNNGDARLDAKFIASILSTMIGQGGALNSILFNDKALDDVAVMRIVRDLMLGLDEHDGEDEIVDCNECGVKECLDLGGSCCDKCDKEFCQDCSNPNGYCEKCNKTFCNNCANVNGFCVKCFTNFCHDCSSNVGGVQFCENCSQHFCHACEPLTWCGASELSYCQACGGCADCKRDGKQCAAGGGAHSDGCGLQ